MDSPSWSSELTRVNIFLPIKSTTILTIHRLIRKLYIDFGGCTHSVISHTQATKFFPGFTGYWIEEPMTRPDVERIVWIMVDVGSDLDNPALEYFSHLKKEIREATRESEVWIVYNSAGRFT